MGSLLVAVAAALALSALTQRVDGLQIPMDHPAILYSPYNWAVSGGTAKTINPGAYLRVIFSGSSCVIATNTSANMGPFSQFWTRVDGGPLQMHVLAPGSPSYAVSLGPPYSASSDHLLELIVKSTSETIPRWNPQSTAVHLTGIVLDPNSTVAAPARRPYNVLVFGDSITEGVRTLGYQGIQNDTDRNDAVRDYSFQLSALLPAEVGVVGFGATGLTKGGSGGVPALGETFKMLWDGVPRDFSLRPDLVVYNEGTNDGSNITTLLSSVVRSMQLEAPSAEQLLLLPFDGSHRGDIEAVVQQVGSPRVHFGDTSGFYSGADGLHPFGYSHVGQIAPKVARLAFGLLGGK